MRILNRQSRNVRTLINSLKPLCSININTLSTAIYYIDEESLIVIARCNIREKRHRKLKYDQLSGLKLKLMEYEILCNGILLFKIMWDKSIYKIMFNDKNPFVLLIKGTIALDSFMCTQDLIKR